MDTTQGTGFSDQAARDRAQLALERQGSWRQLARAWLARLRGDQASVETVARESDESVQQVAERVLAYIEEVLKTYEGHPHGKSVLLDLKERLGRYTM